MARTCPNCSQTLLPEAKFCYNCGQDQKNRLVPIGALIGDVLRDSLAFDTKFFRSVPKLVLKPGRLTTEFVNGKRARYVPPVRLYVFISVIAFFLLALNTNSPSNESQMVRTEADSSGTDNNPFGVQITGLDNVEHQIDSMGVDAWKSKYLDDASGLQLIAMKFSLLHYQGRFGELVTQFHKYLPLGFLLSIPLFAMVMKLLFWRRFYVIHLVFTLHLFAFLLLINTIFSMIGLLFSADPSVLIIIVLPVYIFLALREVFALRLSFNIFSALVLTTLVLTILTGLLFAVGSVAIIAT